MTHICVGKLTNIGSDNGLSPGWYQAIIWTNAGILLIGPLVTNFSESLIVIHTFSFNKMHLKMSSAKWRLFCLGLNELSSARTEITMHKCLTPLDNYVRLQTMLFELTKLTWLPPLRQTRPLNYCNHYQIDYVNAGGDRSDKRHIYSLWPTQRPGAHFTCMTKLKSQHG